MNRFLITTLQELSEVTAARLSTCSNTPQLDTQVLLAHITGEPRTHILAHPEWEPDPRQAAELEALTQRLESGEPLPYVIGHWEFFGLDFDLTPDVLIPRPETELLVERATAWLDAFPDARSVADVGTGSGCIAVSLAMHVPKAHILATDISSKALEVARRNARKFDLAEKIEFTECDILPTWSGTQMPYGPFNLICANLPYIPTEKLQNLPVYGHEPTLALDGGPDGLTPFRKLFGLVPHWLAPGGLMLLEVEATRGTAVLSLAYDCFSSAEMHLHQDLTGQDRLLEIKLPVE